LWLPLLPLPPDEPVPPDGADVEDEDGALVGACVALGEGIIVAGPVAPGDIGGIVIALDPGLATGTGADGAPLLAGIGEDCASAVPDDASASAAAASISRLG
jgi:hypothetical protein